MNPRYWQARTHAQTWRNRQQIELQERQRHSESVGTAFVATIAWITVLLLSACLGLLLIRA